MRMTPAVLRSKIVYMSMEAGLDPAMPTYSGGLGVLAGDTLRAAADLLIPVRMAATTRKRSSSWAAGERVRVSRCVMHQV